MFKTSINMKGLKNVLKSGKPMKMHQFFEIINPPYVTIRIKPHTGSRNQSTKDFGILAAELYKKDTERLHFQKWKVTYSTPECLTYEIEFINGEIQFLISCPKDIASMVMRKCSSVWKDSHVDIDDGYTENWNQQNTVVYELLYAKQDALSLNTAASDNLPLESMFYAIRGMQPTDHAKMYCHIEPRNRGKWMLQYSDVMERLKQGTMLPQKSYNSSIKESVGFWLSKILSSVMLGMSDFLTNSEDNIYKKQMDESNAGRLQLDNLTTSTKEKASSPILRTHLWVLSESDNAVAAQNTAQIIAGSFKDLTENNELMAFEVRGKRKTQVIKETSTKGIPESTRFNLMSHKEIGKIFQVPGLELQTEFPEAVGVKSREIVISDDIFDESGIPLGVTYVKGKAKTVYMPLKDKDMICKPHIVFGMQGTGKTLGFGVHTALEYIKRGYTVFYMDMADGNPIDAVRDGLPEDFPDDKCLDLDFGNGLLPIPCEITDVALRTCSINDNEADLEQIKAANKVSEFFLNFIDKLTEDMGDPFSQRMRNIAKSAGRATLINPSNGLMDMVAVLRDADYRHHIMSLIKDSQPGVYRVLASLDKTNKDNSLDGIADRIAVLSGDITLSNLFLQPPKLTEDGKPLLDYRTFMDNDAGGYGYFVGIRIPRHLEDAIPKIAFFQFAKVWLCAKSREADIPDKEQRHPFVFIVDEPHVFASEGRELFEQASVEARKYRCKLIWLMHSPTQFDGGRSLGNRRGPTVLEQVLSGGLNITGYKTEKIPDYRTFAAQFAPFTDEEIYNSLQPRDHAINKLSLDTNSTPFIADMPHGRVFVKDRSYRRAECSAMYGRPWRKVVEMIELRTQELDIELPEAPTPKRKGRTF